MQNQTILAKVKNDSEEWSKESEIIYSQCRKFLSTDAGTPINKDFNRKLQKSICDLDYEKDL